MENYPFQVYVSFKAIDEYGGVVRPAEVEHLIRQALAMRQIAVVDFKMLTTSDGSRQ